MTAASTAASIDAARLRAAGTSPAAIAHHYVLGDDFFALWLGRERVYSCGLWKDDESPREHLATAQERKLDFFADELAVAGGRVLDIGCGWGALLDRFVRAHGAAAGVGLTLSASQAAFARGRATPRVDFRKESWVDHQPAARYDAITCIEATEHWASDRLAADEKVAVYREFFARCAAWLNDGGRLGLQLIILDNVGHEGSRAGRGPSSELIRLDIFPESMPASLSEMVLGWETDFELVRFVDHSDHYTRTFRAWGLEFRGRREAALALVGSETLRTFERYFATGELYFRRREHALYRVTLRKRGRPKRWACVVWPSAIEALDHTETRTDCGASAGAVRHHYDVSNDFYRLWLGPSMMYSSGMWSSQDEEPSDLDAAHRRKIDWFAAHVLRRRGASVLDVGCGWGHNLRMLVARHRAAPAVGLTLSEAQRDFLVRDSIAGAEIRLESWRDHRPQRRYDAIVSYGAFEHFARDGTSGVERVQAYRAFFERCFEWLADDGRLGLETIAHDGAPDTMSPRGRGPLADAVLDLYPESICPHLCEIVLGFEPYFEIEALRADAADFARTFRLWLLALRANEAAAEAIVGAEAVRRFRSYLVSSEMQFRTGTLTNYRVVLHRRPKLRW
jgi:cyclopropane-fatty-acyl-phospholipid synthase